MFDALKFPNWCDKVKQYCCQNHVKGILKIFIEKVNQNQKVCRFLLLKTFKIL